MNNSVKPRIRSAIEIAAFLSMIAGLLVALFVLEKPVSVGKLYLALFGPALAILVVGWVASATSSEWKAVGFLVLLSPLSLPPIVPGGLIGLLLALLYRVYAVFGLVTYISAPNANPGPVYIASRQVL